MEREDVPSWQGFGGLNLPFSGLSSSAHSNKETLRKIHFFPWNVLSLSKKSSNNVNILNLLDGYVAWDNGVNELGWNGESLNILEDIFDDFTIFYQNLLFSTDE